MARRVIAALLTAALAAANSTAGSPTGLLVDLKRSPSLGVRSKPAFSWIVPACSADAMQTAYQIIVSAASVGDRSRSLGETERTQAKMVVVWDSGKVASNVSTHVACGQELKNGARFTWTVTTWTAAATPGGDDVAPCRSAPSEPGLLVTSLGEGSGWDRSINFVSLPPSAPPATFGYFRKDIAVPIGTVAAVAFVAAPNLDPMLSAYKLYMDGGLVNLGPGRGEAPVWGGDGAFRCTDFDIIFDHLSGMSGLFTTPHTPCYVLYLVAMLIGC